MAAIASIDPTIDWLLKSSEPVVRYRALIDLLQAPPDDDRATDLHREIADGPIVSALMSGQGADDGFDRHGYSKWTGGHWLTGRTLRSNVPVIAGLTRRCASQEGNALASSSADVVDWGIVGPTEPVTLGAMLVLKAAGRTSISTGQRNQLHARTVAAP